MKILYFAWLRERLNKGEEDVMPPAHVTTVGELIGWLRQRDPAADLAMQKPELIRAAVDTRIVDHAARINGAQVIALFPPMTGG
jgi:molybdopterin synthase sulfur carrier subunit